MSDPTKPANQDRSEQEYGEGNYKAGREYQDAVQKTAGTKQSEQAAKEAKRALQSDERAELEAAEKKGKQPGRGVPEK